MENELKFYATKQPKWLVVFRVILGLILFAKGIFFLQNSAYLEQITINKNLSFMDSYRPSVLLFIIYCSLLGGLFISVGLFTRWVSLIQIPILLSAIIFININNNNGLINSELFLSVIVFILLIVFSIKGSGVFSADEYFASYYKAGAEAGHTNKFFE